MFIFWGKPGHFGRVLRERLPQLAGQIEDAGVNPDEVPGATADEIHTPQGTPVFDPMVFDPMHDLLGGIGGISRVESFPSKPANINPDDFLTPDMTGSAPAPQHVTPRAGCFGAPPGDRECSEYVGGVCPGIWTFPRPAPWLHCPMWLGIDEPTTLCEFLPVLGATWHVQGEWYHCFEQHNSYTIQRTVADCVADNGYFYGFVGDPREGTLPPNETTFSQIYTDTYSDPSPLWIPNAYPQDLILMARTGALLSDREHWIHHPGNCGSSVLSRREGGSGRVCSLLVKEDPESVYCWNRYPESVEFLWEATYRGKRAIMLTTPIEQPAAPPIPKPYLPPMAPIILGGATANMQTFAALFAALQHQAESTGRAKRSV